MELTDRRIASLKPTGRREEIKDGRWPLWLIIQPTGTKSFQWRGTVAGRDCRKTLGRYHDGYSGLGLREARDAAMKLRATGMPGAAATQGPSVAECFALYMEREGHKRANAPEKWRMWEREIAPVIGTMLIDQVTRANVAGIVAAKYDAIVAAGGNGVGSNRLHAHLSRFFNWCMAQGWSATRLEHSPMERVKRLAKEEPRKRVLSSTELRWLAAALPAMASNRPNDKSDIYARGFEVILRTLARRSEVFEMAWGWIDGDRLTVPQTKNGDPQVIWLHPSVLRLIGTRPEGAPDSARVFAVHPTAMDKPIRRVRSAMHGVAALDCGAVENWTLRDLRRTATTTMGSFLEPSDRPLVTPLIRDRLLNHRESGSSVPTIITTTTPKRRQHGNCGTIISTPSSLE